MRVSSVYPSYAPYASPPPPQAAAPGGAFIPFRPFSAEAFAEAHARQVPLFLIIGEADAALLEPSLLAQITGRTVPVRLLPGMRPDVELLCQRAGALLSGEGALPLCALLLEDGRPFLAAPLPPSGFPLDPARLLVWLTQADRRFAQNPPAMRAQAAQVIQSFRAQQSPRPLSPGDAAHDLVRTLTAAEDRRSGGFSGIKAPYVPALRFLQHAASGGSRPAHAMLTRALDAMLSSALHDPLDGLFFRSTLTDDWRVFVPEKPLGVNALLALILLESGRRSEAVRILDGICALFPAEGGMLAPYISAPRESYAFSAGQVCEVLGSEDGLRACRLLSLLRQRSGGEPPVTPSRFSPIAAAGGDRAFLREDAPLCPVLSASVTPEDAAFLRRALPLLLRYRSSRRAQSPAAIHLTQDAGLAASVLAVCGRRLGEARYTQAAQRAVSRLIALPPVPGAAGGLPPAYSPCEPSAAQASCGAAAALALAQLSLGQGEGMEEYAGSGLRMLSAALHAFIRPDGLAMHTPEDPAAFFPRVPAVFDGELPSPAAMLIEALRIADTLCPQAGYNEAAAAMWRAAAPYAAGQGASCAALIGAALGVAQQP